VLARNQKHKFIEKIASELFGFGYALIPDQLQVSQIVIDCFQLGKKDLEAKELLDELLMEPESFKRQFLYKKRLCHLLYQMSVKRFSQIRDGISVGPEESAFNALDIKKRAVLYLKHKMNFSLSDISSVTSDEDNNTMSLLSAGRDELLVSAGEVNF